MNADDPKFTAHALGELEDLTTAERAEIEALIASDPAAAAEAAETQALAARLRAELPGEATAALQEGQRAAVLQAAASRVPGDKVVRFPRRVTVLSAIAACIVVGVAIALMAPGLQTEKGLSQKVALNVPGEPLPPLISPEPIDSPQPATPAVPGAKAVVADPAGQADIAKAIGSADTKFASNLPAPEAPLSAAPLAKPAPRMATTPAPAVPPVAEPMAMAENKTALSLRPVAGTAKDASKKASEFNLQDRALDVRAQLAVERPIRKAEGSAASPARTFASRVPSPSEKEFVVAESSLGSSTFDAITENAFLTVRENPLSTLSTDVDTASYAIVRRFLDSNQRPPASAVRIEELLNYFTYDYPQPKGDAPFSATMEVAACPWTPEHRLVRIGLKGREIAKDQRPPSNLVFLIDVSGSMDMPNKLPLLKQSFGLLIDQLREEDQVAIVVYAGNSGCVLEPTHDKRKMREALHRLEAGGSTNGASGIQLAYKLAEKSFVKGGTNRVILATDGDWNVGITNHTELLDMIARKAKSGVFLTVLGFGMDNLQDSMLVKLADRGNGNYGYIDTLLEAKKLFVEQLCGTLVTIAKDVKIQVEFNPAQVGAYRLIGYEKRLLASEDFNNDKKDAGEIGAGHTVTALYEIVPAGQELPHVAMTDKLKYQPQPVRGREDTGALPEPVPSTPAAQTAVAVPPSVRKEMLTLKLRYKAPDGDVSKLLEFPLTDAGQPWDKSSPDFRFAAAVAGYGMLLRDSNYLGEATWPSVDEWAREGQGEDKSGYRAEFLSLLEKARALTR